eukprot:191969_1
MMGSYPSKIVGYMLTSPESNNFVDYFITMLNLNKLMQLIIVTFLIVIIARRRQRSFKWQPRGVSYQRYIWYAVVHILSDYDSFKRYTRFAPTIFVTYLYNPIQNELNISREHYLFPDANDHRHRHCAISNVARVIRCCMFFAGWNRESLKFVFQQSKSTISRDCIFISRVIIQKLYQRYVYSPLPGTREYNQWLGAGVFARYFPYTIYAADIVKIKILRPLVNQRDFYDGHKHEHNVGYLIKCNGYGWPSYCLGPGPGHIRDATFYANSAIFRHAWRFCAVNNYIFGDRIFRYCPPPMLTAYTGLLVYTYMQLLFNYHQSESRIIIENLFGRLKVLFPIFFFHRYRLEYL